MRVSLDNPTIRSCVRLMSRNSFRQRLIIRERSTNSFEGGYLRFLIGLFFQPLIFDDRLRPRSPGFGSLSPCGLTPFGPIRLTCCKYKSLTDCPRSHPVRIHCCTYAVSGAPVCRDAPPRGAWFHIGQSDDSGWSPMLPRVPPALYV